ncbi:MAG: clan AA aspartic protease [Bacteroidales bacterium]|nr:clan AA aspartic protease [Bacteroidales bacterium]
MITRIPIKLIDLNGDGYHLSLEAQINDEPVLLILDTGASRTVFDMNRISRFVKNPGLELNEQLSTGLGTNSMESNILQIDSFILGEMQIKNYSSVAIDMVHINQTYEMLEMPSIDGVLGGDILKEFDAKIDYRSLLLSLKFPKAKYYIGISK